MSSGGYFGILHRRITEQPVFFPSTHLFEFVKDLQVALKGLLCMECPQMQVSGSSKVTAMFDIV